MPPLILSKRELAQAFEVSENTVGHWTARGLPRLSGGRPGIQCEYDFEEAEKFVVRNIAFRDRRLPVEELVILAYRRALEIVAARQYSGDTARPT